VTEENKNRNSLTYKLSMTAIMEKGESFMVIIGYEERYVIGQRPGGEEGKDQPLQHEEEKDVLLCLKRRTAL